MRALAEQLLREPVRIDVAHAAGEARRDIQQRAIEVDAGTPHAAAASPDSSSTAGRASLVFVATKYATEHVADKLQRAGIAAAALHGELSQGARTQALADFKAGACRCWSRPTSPRAASTSRELPAVVNFDLPRSADDYVHRIGRTGRAGESGVAVSFVSAATEAHFRLIEKRNRLPAGA